MSKIVSFLSAEDTQNYQIIFNDLQIHFFMSLFDQYLFLHLCVEPEWND